MAENQESKGSILDILALILDIQELDMQMLQLMRLKKEREREMDNINGIKKDLMTQQASKESEILDLKTSIRLGEGDLKEIQDRVKKLEDQQSSIKKVEEFNALSQEMAQADRERNHKEKSLSELYDRLAEEEEVLESIKESLDSTSESSRILENEIVERLTKINEEGKQLLTQRQELVAKADPDVFAIYERLLKNKKDRVVVPIENRSCSGCHINLTAQDENMVRKAERLIFCEHCSRVLYWVQSEELEGTTAAPTRQRRRRTRAS
ncbi:MAG: C4-type zinc ribbon domain-containing protein [Chlamydiota bacterium]|nr:C4-type zinc ribbon domain-containing protein [Chlamydiota bacterium]